MLSTFRLYRFHNLTTSFYMHFIPNNVILFKHELEWTKVLTWNIFMGREFEKVPRIWGGIMGQSNYQKFSKSRLSSTKFQLGKNDAQNGKRGFVQNLVKNRIPLSQGVIKKSNLIPFEKYAQNKGSSFRLQQVFYLFIEHYNACTYKYIRIPLSALKFKV